MLKDTLCSVKRLENPLVDLAGIAVVREENDRAGSKVISSPMTLVGIMGG